MTAVKDGKKETAKCVPNDYLIKAYKTRSGKQCGKRKTFSWTTGLHYCLYNEGHLKQGIPHYFMFAEEDLKHLTKELTIA